ncbi:hypothetical protein HDA40_001310 [Hamadaea flava]|uniref:DUF222 domain-containing protein n=1 Tax=Hamadaea flava TaxID=1742688 RepID=A0ABV8LQD6_9ACTN|nr:HNH endonuclease signature motif containing protein [Hamadaea flava]MCP2322803.1 hypothetical protein [Hamadaea flava]
MTPWKAPDGCSNVDSVNGVLAQVEAGVAELATGPLWTLSDTEITDEVRRVHATIQALSGRFLTLIGAADSRDIPHNAGATGTANWLSYLLAMRHRDAQAWTKLAGMLPAVPVVEAALADGRVNVEQARVIAKTVHDLPSGVGELGKAKAAEVLTKLATDDRLLPEVLEKHQRQILETVAPEIADDKLRRDLDRAERSAYDRRDFTLIPYGEGEYRVRGILDTEAAAIVRTALDPLSGPRKPAPTVAAAIGADACGGSDAVNDDCAAARVVPGEPDPRSAGARRADALVEVCQRIMDAGELPDNGGEKPHLTITLPWDALQAKVAAGLLDTGDLLTPETVRRLACDAMIIPAVLGGDGQVLDVGRARRLIDGPLRRALVLRDKGCAFPGCERPPQWCHGHHLKAWADGGTTCLANSVLLCGFHHREIHHGLWEVRMRPDGLPEFLPPAFVDPLRRAVRNTLHRRC